MTTYAYRPTGPWSVCKKCGQTVAWTADGVPLSISTIDATGSNGMTARPHAEFCSVKVAVKRAVAGPAQRTLFDFAEALS